MKWFLYALIFVISYFGYAFFHFGNISIYILIIILFLVLFFQLIIHEFGHLVFGLLTGYKFISYRIMFFLFTIENGRLKMLFLPENAFWGQCLMAPPEKNDKGNFPYYWYNAGGVVNNLFTALVMLIPLFLTTGIWQLIAFAFAWCGIILAVLNAIPSLDKIPNDGHNIRSMRRSVNAREAYYIQLHANAVVFKGGSYASIPDSVFAQLSGVKINNPLIVTAKFIEYYHYCHNLNFIKASEIIVQLDRARDILKYHADLISLERIFIMIINEDYTNAQIRLDNLPTNVRPALMNSKEIDKKRILLAINALMGKNEQATAQLYQQASQAARQFHLRGVAQDELKVIEYIKNKYEESLHKSTIPE